MSGHDEHPGTNNAENKWQ